MHARPYIAPRQQACVEGPYGAPRPASSEKLKYVQCTEAVIEKFSNKPTNQASKQASKQPTNPTNSP